MRLTVAAAVSCLLLSSLAAAEHAVAAITKPTNIPAQSLESALEMFARERSLQLVYATEDVGNLRSPGAIGELTPGDALRLLLKGTGLSYQFLDDKTVTVQSAVVSRPNGAAVLESDSQATDPNNTGLWSRFRLAQEGQGASSDAASVGGTAVSSEMGPTESAKLDEVVVTAQKKSERLQDVPVPVTVLNTEQLAASNKNRLQDYFTLVPGFNVTPDSFDRTALSIRGVSPLGGSPTVGIVIDDVPFGLSGGTQTGFVPDIDPADLDSIEILRGPQGALYGASSMGGLVKFVTRDPAFDAVSGRVEAGASDVRNGAEPGYDVRASANVPVNDTLAVRVSGFTRQDPGYIDNPILHVDGINQAQSYGGRFAALWRPSSDFSIKLNALFQSSKENGLSEVDIPTQGFPQTYGLGSLQQNSLAGTGQDALSIQDYSAIVNAKIGAVDVTSLTGYNVTQVPWSIDFGFLFTPALVGAAFPTLGVTGVPYFEHDHEIKFSQELRLAASVGKVVDIVVGGFYTHENSGAYFTTYAQDSSNRLVGTYWTENQPISTLDEYAGFANFTFHITDRFDIQTGARESFFDQGLGEVIQTGPYALAFLGGSPNVSPALSGSENAFTYLLTPRFKITPDMMVYARFASGYRPGQPNVAEPGLPRESAPDKTHDSEIGLKADLPDYKVSIDASFYYVDWKDIQLQFTDQATGFKYTANAAGAKSEGAELSVTAHPLIGALVGLTFAYDDAVLTKGFPADSQYVGKPGDRLPQTSRYSGSLTLQQEFPLASGTGFAGAIASYVGDREGVFVGSPQRQDLPGYTKLDLHAGIRRDGWTVTAYANNVTDERGLLDGGAGYFFSPARIYITPRTVGFTASKSF